MLPFLLTLTTLVSASSTSSSSTSSTTTSLLMDVMGRAAESLRPRLEEFSRGSPRPIIGAYLASIHEELHAMWDPLPESLKSRAITQATTPLPGAPSIPGPYWRWVPVPQGYALPSPSPPLNFSSPCFSSNTATGSFSPDGQSYSVTVHATSPPASASCMDSYLIGTVDSLSVVTLNSTVTTVTTTLPVSSRKAAELWVSHHGALVMRFLDPEPLTILYELVETVGLFIPSLITSPLAPQDSASNVDFAQRYANITLTPRDKADQVWLDIDPSLFNSGDILFITRVDGLATLEMWGTGAHTSHTTVLLRSDYTGELFVVESQSNGADWPIDRIQMNPFDTWKKYSDQASYSVVWLPITDATKARWNNTAAWEYFNSTVGANYGYQDFATTFYDTLRDNLPYPATPEALEVVVGVVEGLLGWIQAENTPLINLLFAQTLVQRLGTDRLPFTATLLEALEEGYQQGKTFPELMATPELDSNRYPQLAGPRNGTSSVSLVCNAWACALHKAAGSFGPTQLNCAETQNSDVYQLDLFQANPVRPAVCIARDPGNPHCQLSGPFSFTLNGAGTVKPYDGMDERCPSLPMAYSRPSDC